MHLRSHEVLFFEKDDRPLDERSQNGCVYFVESKGEGEENEERESHVTGGQDSDALARHTNVLDIDTIKDRLDKY